jgi:hypothetical protein
LFPLALLKAKISASLTICVIGQNLPRRPMVFLALIFAHNFLNGNKALVDNCQGYLQSRLSHLPCPVRVLGPSTKYIAQFWKIYFLQATPCYFNLYGAIHNKWNTILDLLPSLCIVWLQ